MSNTAPNPAMPGYRRRLVVEPGPGRSVAMLEDDMHRMAVVLHHDGQRIDRIDALMDRAPWDTCPGARAKLRETFVGSALIEVTARRDKKQNCTHLHDLAVLAAAHAGDDGPTIWDIRASDPQSGRRLIEIARNGETVHRWVEERGVLVSPAPIAGLTLPVLRDWIATLPGPEQEAARLLQWAAMVAHGRTLPIEQQSQASDLPANCYTFQPERAVHAVRVGDVRDFSSGDTQPLDGMRLPS